MGGRTCEIDDMCMPAPVAFTTSSPPDPRLAEHVICAGITELTERRARNRSIARSVVHLATQHVLARERAGVGVLYEREVRDGREVGREASAVSVREGDAEDDEVCVGGRGHGARTKEANEGRSKGGLLERSTQAQTTAER
jgi:hypothetical protein